MRPKYKDLIKDLLFEQNQVDIVVLKIKQIKDEAGEVYTAALGAYLMNFYNGIENIMKRCAKVYYGIVVKCHLCVFARNEVTKQSFLVVGEIDCHTPFGRSQ